MKTKPINIIVALQFSLSNSRSAKSKLIGNGVESLLFRQPNDEFPAGHNIGAVVVRRTCRKICGGGIRPDGSDVSAEANCWDRVGFSGGRWGKFRRRDELSTGFVAGK